PAILVLGVGTARAERDALALEHHICLEAVRRLGAGLQRHRPEQAAIDARAGDDRAGFLHRPLRARRRQHLHVEPRRLLVVRPLAAALAEEALQAARALAVRAAEVDVGR